MTRPVDWAPLASSDPVPGDPSRMAAVASQNLALAELLEQQTATLREVATQEAWDADAGRVFARSAQDLAGRLDAVRRRYSTVAQALGRFVPQLRQAQYEADAARVAAREAQTRIEANAPLPADGVPTPDQVTAARVRASAHTEAAADLDRARRRLAEAVRDRDTAARTAEQRIREAIEHDGLRDSFWDKTKDWASDRWDSALAWVHRHAAVIRFVADACGAVATVLSLIAIAISFIPVLNFLSPVLLGIAAGLTVVALVCHLALALSGDGSWLDVGLDIFSLVTFGFGRVAAKGLGIARNALRREAKSALRTGARRKAAGRGRDLARMLASRTTATGARRAARSELRALKKQATRQATRRTASLERTAGRWTRGLLYGDGELAKIRNGARAIQRAVAKDKALVGEEGVARVDRAAADVMHRVHVMAGVGLTAVTIDVADRPTSLTLWNGEVIDLNWKLPDKPSYLDPLKPAFVWGRYASGE